MNIVTMYMRAREKRKKEKGGERERKGSKGEG
jgi:hypothetical protein